MRYLPRRRWLGSLIGLLAAVLPAALLWWQHQNIIDWVKLRNYQPPASIRALAIDDSMTPKAEHIFYVNHPKLISDRNEFADSCSVAEQTIIEGCYRSSQSGIFIFDVSDPALRGIEQVTAAHEMLHAAYERLSSSDREYVDGLLTSYYQRSLKDERILKTIESYKKTEPNDLVNEMHSIFGTEVASLPAPLEKYYQRYFTSRAKVVSFSEKYEEQFTSRLNQINAYDKQLAAMRVEILSRQKSLNSQSAKIEADRARLDSLKASGQYDEYNAAVPGFNNEINSYNAQVAQLQALTSDYNQLVVTRNNLARDYRDLQAKIDTRVQSQATQ